VLGHHRLALYGTPLVRSQPARRFRVHLERRPHGSARGSALPASRRSKRGTQHVDHVEWGSHLATDTPCDVASGRAVAGADGPKRIRRVWRPASVSIFSVLSSSQVTWMRPRAHDGRGAERFAATGLIRSPRVRRFSARGVEGTLP